MSERRKIILHIGAGKTGSSAIQSFLSLNLDALRKAGIVVPDTDLKLADKITGTHVRTMRALATEPVKGREQLEAAIADLFEQIGDTAALLISAENLASYPTAPLLFEGLAQDHDIEAIVYIRRQDEFVLSAWQQWNAKVQEDFLAWLIASVGTLGNWQTYLMNWEKVLPREKIKVRIFDRKQLTGGDVIVDFFSLLGLPTPFETFAYPTEEANPSYTDAVMDLVKGDNNIFRDAHDNRFQEFVHEVTGDRYVKDSKESLLTSAQRRAVVARYAASNLWVQKAYFPDKTEGLFRPIQDGDYFQPDSKSTLRRQLSFIVSIVFGLYRWRKEPKKKRGKREV